MKFLVIRQNKYRENIATQSFFCRLSVIIGKKYIILQEGVYSMDEIGKVTHYFGKVSVAVVELTATISVGDRIAFKGSNSDFEQVVASMQIDHEDIETAQAGQAVGLKVDNRVKGGDVVYKV